MDHEDDEQRERAADRLGGEFVRVLKLFERFSSRYAPQPGEGLERAAYRLLAALVVEGPRRSGALAALVHSDPSTVSRQVAALVRVGYVERVADPEDGRATLVAATPVGRAVFERHRRKRTEYLAAITAGWTTGDVETLSDLLARFAQDVESFEPCLPDLVSPREPAADLLTDPPSPTKGHTA